MADDIFYERFPEELKGAAPRIWYEDGAYMVGMKGKAWTGGDFGRVLMQYDDLAGAASNDIEARIRELKEDGIDKELAFPNAVLALFHYPDKSLRERVFRIYNEHIADLQERSKGHFYGVGLINWWDPKGTRSTLEELKALGLKTFLLPLNPGKDDDGNIYDYGSTDMDAVWDEIEDVWCAGQPPHRRDATEDAVPEQQRRGRHDGERRLVPRAVRQVRLLRHPGPAPDR